MNDADQEDFDNLEERVARLESALSVLVTTAIKSKDLHVCYAAEQAKKCL